MAVFAPIDAINLGGRAIEAIRGAIITGELAPGEGLSDRMLADELGVSRTPVREALHRLQADGLVEPQGRAGWAVAAFTAQDVHEIFQLRMLLEPFGLAELERSRDPDQIARIASSFVGFEHPIEPDRLLEYFRCDDGFHTTIVESSNSRRIQGVYEVLNAQINRGRFILSGSNSDRLEQTLDEHRAVVAAILDGDFPRARSALLAHLRSGEELMIAELSRRDGRSSPRAPSVPGVERTRDE